MTGTIDRSHADAWFDDDLTNTGDAVAELDDFLGTPGDRVSKRGQRVGTIDGGVHRSCRP
jgi:hypothetical protein